MSEEIILATKHGNVTVLTMNYLYTDRFFEE